MSPEDIRRLLWEVDSFDRDLRIWVSRQGEEVNFTIAPPGFRLEDSADEDEPETTVVTLPSAPGARPAAPPMEPAREIQSPVASGATPSRIRVSAAVQAAKLVTKIAPEYPGLATVAQVQGVVRLSVIIDSAGRVANTFVLAGHPLLIDAALTAVKQWVYRPTIVNGKAVEVVTEVEVEFFRLD